MRKKLVLSITTAPAAAAFGANSADTFDPGEDKTISTPLKSNFASCVRVPVFIGHSEMINVEFEEEMSAALAKKIWLKAPGITLIDLESDMGYVTPAEIAGEDQVFISRVREDSTLENGLNFWCVADNLRKGAALNAVQIAERLVKEYL
jgi:aspartate-semialdehyde dehydrogenase